MFVEKPKEEVYDVVINEVGSFEITVDVLLVSKCENRIVSEINMADLLSTFRREFWFLSLWMWTPCVHAKFCR